MLQTIRDKITGSVATIFLGAIAVVFVFWGIDFQSGGMNYAAKVDDRRSPPEVRHAWQQRQSQLQQMLRCELPPELVKSQQAALLDQFVRETLLKQRAEKLGYRVSDQASPSACRIRAAPGRRQVFQGSLRRAAACHGQTEPQFEADLRKLMIAQIQSGVVESAFVAPYEVDRRFLDRDQERELDYALIATSEFAGRSR